MSNHHPPDPPPGRRRGPRAEEATQVLLHPLRGSDAEPDLAVRLHPLSPHQPRRQPGVDVEIISWLNDCTRYALHVSAHARVTTEIVKATFRKTTAQHGVPASTLTDNGMVYTVRFAGGRGGRNVFEEKLHDRHVIQKNSRPSHPTTCGKAERFQQTMKNWLAAQPVQPETVDELQALLTPSQRSTTTTGRTGRYPTGPPPPPSTSRCPRPSPARSPTPPPTTGSATTSRQGRLGHPALPQPTPPHRHRATDAGTCVILLVQDLDIRVVNAATGELLRELVLDPPATTSPPEHPKDPPGEPRNDGSRTCNRRSGCRGCLEHHIVAGAGFEPATSGL